ncbi:hypothetical protein, partial [Bifidobacterium longum]|uniref:hypothetical protein n=1 Tax=Bifidobacterium longum TaxID=216816 RepID=UPI0022AEF513
LKADDPRLDPSMLTNRERTRVVDAIRGEFGLAACLKAVGLKRVFRQVGVSCLVMYFFRV